MVMFSFSYVLERHFAPNPSTHDPAGTCRTRLTHNATMKRSSLPRTPSILKPTTLPPVCPRNSIYYSWVRYAATPTKITLGIRVYVIFLQPHSGMQGCDSSSWPEGLQFTRPSVNPAGCHQILHILSLFSQCFFHLFELTETITPTHCIFPVAARGVFCTTPIIPDLKTAVLSVQLFITNSRNISHPHNHSIRTYYPLFSLWYHLLMRLLPSMMSRLL